MNKDLEELEIEAHRLSGVAFRIKQRRLELERIVIKLLDDEFEVQGEYENLVDKIYSIKWEKVEV
jgi:hypothetical protein